ncbi:MAG: DUF1523 domain-containing protein [Cereibacter sphaeroides]|uniref:DUF1523 domain-containing protein n=1 Tax=Cereibacter sphaeroides TaxID=1063 RepID=A0A2W5TQK0_CERSP|nr:MAG: DUF1523 domain-containing protein [Cereibacter sphaeroides]
MKWGFLTTILLIVVAFLNYTLPQRDIVRITNTYNRQTAVGSNWLFYSVPDVGTAESNAIRDIRFIEAVRPNGKVIVYRNEDTGWIWPPYFKYNSSDLQAEANNLISPASAPQWVAVTKYGWRIAFFSIYPNAVKVRPVEGPDVSLVPWVNIIILAVLAFLLFMLRRMWLQFRERMIDPAVENMGDALERADARADIARANARTSLGRFRAWVGSWFR